MTTIVINENTKEGRLLMQRVRRLKNSADAAVVHIYDDDADALGVGLGHVSAPASTVIERIPGVPHTKAELIEQVKRIEAEHNSEVLIPQAKVFKHLEKRIGEWK